MKKDIFIDNNVAKNFSNPLDDEYKKLIAWLMKYDPEKNDENAYLVVSNKLMGEYLRTSSLALSSTSVPIIIDKMTREGRLFKIENREIKAFQQKHFTKQCIKKLRSNRDDHDHIPVVVLSYRKYALSLDNDFIYDLTHFPGFQVKAEKRPEQLPYQ